MPHVFDPPPTPRRPPWDLVVCLVFMVACIVDDVCFGHVSAVLDAITHDCSCPCYEDEFTNLMWSVHGVPFCVIMRPARMLFHKLPFD